MNSFIINEDLFLEEYLCAKASHNNSIITAGFELTPLCNMNCQMCYIRLSKVEQEKEHRLRTCDDWLSLAQKLHEKGTLFLLLTGGEPLLYPHFFELYSALKKMGFIITINSNGTLLSEEMIKLFAKELPRRINITIYGASNETYEKVTGNPKCYDQLMSALHLLKKYKIPTKLNCSLIRENMADTPAILKLSEDLSLPLEYNTYMFPCSRRKYSSFSYESRVTPEEAAYWEIYIKKFQKKMNFISLRNKVLEDFQSPISEMPHKEKMQCRAGKSSCWINWKGEMTPCVFFDTPAISVFDTSLDHAWETIQKSCDKTFLPIECTSCKYRKHCSVCAACAKCEVGDTQKRPEYMCKYMAHTHTLLQQNHINTSRHLT